jgi:hypothetical protein
MFYDFMSKIICFYTETLILSGAPVLDALLEFAPLKRLEVLPKRSINLQFLIFVQFIKNIENI